MRVFTLRFTIIAMAVTVFPNASWRMQNTEVMFSILRPLRHAGSFAK